jgi:hypothetical protein
MKPPYEDCQRDEPSDDAPPFHEMRGHLLVRRMNSIFSNFLCVRRMRQSIASARCQLDLPTACQDIRKTISQRASNATMDAKPPNFPQFLFHSQKLKFRGGSQPEKLRPFPRQATVTHVRQGRAAVTHGVLANSTLTIQRPTQSRIPIGIRTGLRGFM